MTSSFIALPDIGVTLTPTTNVLGSTTLDLPAIGVTLIFIGVSLGSTGVAAPSVTTFNFSLATSSMYLPLLGGFA